MKKILMSSLMVLVSACMFAATHTWTNVLEIKLTDGNNDTYTSRFGEASDLSNTALWSPSAATFEGATVKAYVEYQGVNYEKLYLNDFADNTPLIVKTYNSDQLTFNLKALYGTVTLHDNADGTDYTVDAAGTATLSQTFTVATNATIADRFVIFYVPAPTGYNVTLNSFGLATFSAEEKTLVPAGLEAYIAGDLSGEALTLAKVAIEGGVIPANTGVLLFGAAGNYTMAIYEGTDDPVDVDGNMFHASSEWATSTKENVYILHDNELWLYTGTEFKANKAYLQIHMPAGQAYAPKRISLRYDAATGVEDVKAAAKAEKFMQDGKVLIKRGEAIYNLQGQVVK